jgi:hypothetical protein
MDPAVKRLLAIRLTTEVTWFWWKHHRCPGFRQTETADLIGCYCPLHGKGIAV